MNKRAKIKIDALLELYWRKYEEQEKLCIAPLYIFPLEEHKERHRELQAELTEIGRQLSRVEI